jgi:hypothetical protein
VTGGGTVPLIAAGKRWRSRRHAGTRAEETRMGMGLPKGSAWRRGCTDSRSQRILRGTHTWGMRGPRCSPCACQCPEGSAASKSGSIPVSVDNRCTNESFEMTDMEQVLTLKCCYSCGRGALVCCCISTPPGFHTRVESNKLEGNNYGYCSSD